MLNRYQLLVSVICAGIYFFFISIEYVGLSDVIRLIASLQMGLGVYLVLKFIQYFFFSKKTLGKVVQSIKSATSTGKTQDIGSYLTTSRYSFLIQNEIYTMPENYYIAEKYRIGDMIKVAISDCKKKIAIPVRSVVRLLFFGLVSLFMSIGIILK